MLECGVRPAGERVQVKDPSPHTEPPGGDPDAPCAHLPVDPHWQCPGRAAAAGFPRLLPLEGKHGFGWKYGPGAHALRGP